jgi:hypothetical protein
MLKLGEANRLAVFGLRRVHHLPPHFTVVDFDIRTNEKTITDWIWTHLSGRFYLADRFSNADDSSKNVRLHKCAAFEIPGEASYFSLILDTINNQQILL